MLTPSPTSRWRQAATAAVFVVPLAMFMAAFIFVPVIGTAVNSLFRDVAFMETAFAGAQNFARLLRDPAFWQSMRFTLLFVGVSVPVELALGFIFALALNEAVPMRGLMRGCLLIPWAIPAAISARVWELIYNYQFGLANFVLLRLGLVQEPVNWLGTAAGAFFAVVGADVWKTTPFMTIILLAGLQTIPEDLYEQSRIDGASAGRQFVSITLPLLRPIIVVALLFRTIDAIRVFDIIYILTGGGPGGATTSLSQYAYTYYLSGDFGFGSAASVLVFGLAFGFSLVYIYAGGFTREVR